MNERLKQIRKDSGLNLRDFSSRLGMSHSAINLLENGQRNFTSQFIKSLCNEYHVNEEWFRTGNGEMYITISRESEIADIAMALINEEDGFRTRLIKVISGLSSEQLEVFKNIIYELAKENSPT